MLWNFYVTEFLAPRHLLVSQESVCGWHVSGTVPTPRDVCFWVPSTREMQASIAHLAALGLAHFVGILMPASSFIHLSKSK